MTHEVEPGHLFFESEQFTLVHLFEGRHFIFALRRFARGGIEEAELTVDIAAAVVLELSRYLRESVEHLAAVRAESVERAAFYEALDRAFVELLILHTLAERIEGFELPACFALAFNLSYKARADISHGEQTEIYLSVLWSETLGADIDIGRHDLDTEARALRDIFGNFRRIIEHAADESRHELAGIMALEPRRCIGNKGIGGGVGFVERIGRE